jgi:hypothetical protein
MPVRSLRCRDARTVECTAQRCSNADDAALELEKLGNIALRLFGQAVASESPSTVGFNSPWRRPAARRTRSDSKVARNAPEHLSFALSAIPPLTAPIKFRIHHEVTSNGAACWPTRAMLDAAEFLQSAVDQYCLHSQRLRLGVAGSSRTLHNIVNAFAILRKSNSLNCTTLQIYLLPLGADNPLGEFVARSDCW